MQSPGRQCLTTMSPSRAPTRHPHRVPPARLVMGVLARARQPLRCPRTTAGRAAGSCLLLPAPWRAWHQLCTIETRPQRAPPSGEAMGTLTSPMKGILPNACVDTAAPELQPGPFASGSSTLPPLPSPAQEEGSGRAPQPAWASLPRGSQEGDWAVWHQWERLEPGGPGGSTSQQWRGGEMGAALAPRASEKCRGTGQRGDGEEEDGGGGRGWGGGGVQRQ